MSVREYRGRPYHLWNPFTEMNDLFSTLGVGPSLIARGEGPYVYNERGDRFINGFSSLWNVALGHGRRELVEAATQQMQELAYASCFRQSHPRAIELAAKLVEITDHRYDHVYLGTNGSEAVETALKMARQYHRQSRHSKDHGRYKVISLRGSYHGVSYGALSTSGLEEDAAKFGPLVPGFEQIEPPYCYRCPYKKTGYPECGLACADALEERIVAAGDESVAAFILEPVMGAFGVVAPPPEYYQRTGEICRDRGLLFIVDEVTTGFGRTGKLFASEEWDPAPDILCLGKAISSGYLPLSATLVRDELYVRFLGEGNQFEHGSTASGHPVCAAVGLASIEIMIGERVAENAASMGEYLLPAVQERVGSHRHVGDVRGRGMMIGIEMVKDKETKTHLNPGKAFDFVLDCAALGLLVYSKGHTVGLFSPLTIDKGVADEIIAAVEEAFTGGLAARTARKLQMAKELASVKLGRG